MKHPTACCLPLILFLITHFQLLNAQNVLFANRMGGVQFDQTMGIAVEANKNVIAVGYFAGTADFNSSLTSDSSIATNGYNDIFVVKNDSSGSFIWAFNIGGTLDDFTYANPVVDAAGNIYVCGVFSDSVDFDPSPSATYKITSNGQWDGFIAKYNTNGNFAWVKTFGGLLNDDVYSIALTQSQDLILAGSFDMAADLNPDTAAVTIYNAIGGTDIFYARLSSSGNLQWLHTIGGNAFDHANSIGEDINQDIILQGGFTNSIDVDPTVVTANITGNNAPGFIAKYNSNGNYIWANAFNALTPFGVITDNDANIYTCGYINANTDMNPGPDTNLIFLIGSFDAYVAKYDATGNYINAFKIGSNNFDVAYGIQFLGNDKIVVGGYFNNSADFNPSTASVNALSSFGMADVFIATYDTAFNYVNAFKAGSAMFDFCRNIIVNDEDLLMAGGFSATADFNPGVALTTLTSVGSRDGFVVKYGDVATNIYNSTFSIPETISMYPNPTNNFLFYHLETGIKKGSVDIYSMEGKHVLTQIWHEHKLPGSIDVSHLKQGIYFISFVLDESKYHSKFIKH